jgi:hypothetical protein
MKSTVFHVSESYSAIYNDILHEIYSLQVVWPNFYVVLTAPMCAGAYNIKQGVY